MVIENEWWVVEIEEEHGLIVGMRDKAAGIEVIAEPRLADNFRLLLPLGDLEANYILGRQQKLSAAETTDGGLSLRWDGPLHNERGEWDLDVVLRLGFAGEAVTFDLEVVNRTDHDLAEAWYPLLGGMAAMGEPADTEMMLPTSGWGWIMQPFVRFHESMPPGAGIPGSRWPEFIAGYPGGVSMPWVDFYDRRLGRGLYVGSHDEIARYRVFRMEMHPGIKHNTDGSNWPREEHRDERWPSGIILGWAHFPYTKPGETFRGSQIVVRGHEGDWHEATRIFRAWYDTKFKAVDPKRSWMHEELAVQDTLFLMPEGNVQMTYADVPRWAADAKEYGVGTVMMSGWDLGGHDSHYPRYEPDPRLGTWEELERAVAAVHDLGMRVIFFANFSPVDCATDWFREELHKYQSMSRWGVTDRMGWGMGTLGARLGFTARPLTNVSAGFPKYRAIIVRQMRRLAEIGADGVHLDKLIPPPMDFNPALKLSPDRASWEGTLAGLGEILAACREVNPEFALSVESVWDRLLEYSDVAWCWHSHAGPEHVPVFKYAFPQWWPSMFVCQAYDYNEINNAVRYGYQLYVGPGRYMASMADEQTRPLAEYVREVLRMWDGLRETIIDGEFLDKEGVRVEAPLPVKFSVHRNRRTGQRACVLMNAGDEAAEARVEFVGGEGKGATVHDPGHEARKAELPSILTVAAERVVVVIEEG